MKQENGAKSKKWLLPVLILVALAVVAGVALAILLPGQGGQQGNADAEAGRITLYWNYEGASYIEAETGMSTREKGEDGLYHIKLLADGQEQEFLCADKQLINHMDTMTLMVLTFDENGYIVDAIEAGEAKDVITKIADGFYVQRVEGTSISVNTSFAMNGMELRFELGENCQIYNMDARSEQLGQAGTLDLMDQVAIYGLDETTPTHIFILERAPQTGVYFRAARMYDSATGMTTRVPDENGVYTIQFAYKGQLVDVKCKDKALVTAIDAQSPLIGEVAPIFDEEGYLVDTVSVILALRGKQLAQDYHVVEVLGNNTYKVERISSGSEQGRVLTVTLDENCEIYNVCQYGGCCAFTGEKSEGLQLYDRLNMFGDLNGNPILIHVTRRLVDVPVYWNLKRMYTSADGGHTTRVPDEKGYYVFDMLQDGKPVTVRTKDKAIATAIDYPYDTTVGLALDGDIVTKVYTAKEVIGSYSPGYRRYVTTITGSLMVLTSADDPTVSANVIMTEDCKIYDVTGNPGVKKGTPTEVKLGDRVIAWYNYREQVSYVFVTDRQITIREYCEYCQKKVKWEAAPKNGLSTIDTGKHLHYVLGEDVDVEWGYGVLSKGTTLCLNLYGSNINHATRIFVGGGSKLNLMGKGTITATGVHKNDGLKTGNITVTDGEVNIYSGVTVKSGKKDMPAIYVNGKNAVVNLHGGKIRGITNINNGLLNLDGKTELTGTNGKLQDAIYIGTKGRLNVKETWTGEASMKAAIFSLEGISKTYGTSEGAFTGKLIYECEGNPKVTGQDGGLVVEGGIIPDENDPNYRMCEHCGQKVMWVAAPTTGHSTVDTGEHMHYYLDADFDQAWGYLSLTNNTTMCLDLNGHTINQTGRILVGSGMLNIMGEGKVITNMPANTGLATGGITVQKGTVNIYGGTYISTGEALPNISTMAKEAVVNLHGGTVQGGLRITNGTVNLDGNAKVLGAEGQLRDNILVAATGKLNVKATWTGEATVKMEVLSGGAIELANGTSEGAFTGKLSYESQGNPAVIGKDGGLEIQGEVLPFEDDPFYRWCEHCGTKVLWTEANPSGLSGIDSGKHLHYWLRQDTAALTWGYGTFSNDSEICLDLDGHTITHATRIYLSFANLNLMNGTIISDNSGTNAGYNTGCITVGAGELNVYNATIISTNDVAPAVSALYAGATVKLHKGAKVQGGLGAVKGNVTLDQDAIVDLVALDDDAKLHVEKTWEGTAALLLETLTNPIVNADCTGSFNGTLTYQAEGEPAITGLDGKLYIAGYEVVEPEPEEPETPAEPVFPQDAALDSKVTGYCRVCQKEVEWVCKTNGIATIQDGGHHHYFIASDRTLTWSMGTLDQGTTVCLHMNGTTWGGNSRVLVTGGSTMNIFGGGTLLTTGTGSASMLTGALTVFNGTVNVYDVTIQGTEAVPAVTTQFAQATVNLLEGSEAKGAVNVNNGNVTLAGSAKTGEIKVAEGGKLTVKESFTGSATATFAAALEEKLVPAANGAAEGNFTGNLTTVNGEKITNQEGRLLVEVAEVVDPDVLVLDANNMGFCQHCKTTVEWKAAGGSGLSTISDGQHHHLYMTTDFNYTWGYVTLTNGTKLCLHLNGHKIQQRGRIYLGNAELSILGKGSVATTVAHSSETYNTGAITINNATVNIYGGTYDAPIEGIPAIYSQNAASVLNIYGGTVNGKADITKGNVTLGGNALVADLQVAESAKLTVKADFAGMAAVNFAAALKENLVPAANGAAEGDFSGALVTQAGEKIVNQEGRLRVDAGKLLLDENGMGYCQHCKTIVEWKAAGTTGLSTVSDGQHHHLYMTADFTYTWGYVTLTGGTKLCLHLNGHNIQQRGRILVASSQLSIMGSGKVASIEASTNNDMNSGAITSRKSTVTLYGGTYESPVAGIPAVKLEYAEDQLLLLGGNVTGTAKVTFAAALAEGKVPAANGASEGAFTGNLTVGEVKLIGKDGSLEAAA